MCRLDVMNGDVGPAISRKRMMHKERVSFADPLSLISGYPRILKLNL